MNESGDARRAVARLRPWLVKQQSKNPLAIVLGESCNGLSFVRSLARRGIPTLLLGTERLLGTFTRFGKDVMLPPADSCEAEWLTFLELLSSCLPQPGVLFPTSDLHNLLISRNRDALERSFRFLIPDPQPLERIINKRSQYEAARAARIHIPDVRFPESIEELRHLATDLPYPCILKPYYSHSARTRMDKKKVLVVYSKAELLSAFERITQLDVPLMIQEIIPGEDSALFGYLAFWDSQGRERAWLTKRKLRQYPPGFGDGSLQITVDAPEVAELSRRLLRAFDYRGFVGVEFKLDSRDGTYRLMEINPRTVSGNQLGISAGIDFPWIGYQYLTGTEPEAVPFRPNVKYVNEEWDIQSFLALRRSGDITLGRWLDSLRGAQAKAIWAWDDPIPLVVGLGRFMRLLIPGWQTIRGGSTPAV